MESEKRENEKKTYFVVCALKENWKNKQIISQEN